MITDSYGSEVRRHVYITCKYFTCGFLRMIPKRREAMATRHPDFSLTRAFTGPGVEIRCMLMDSW